MDGNANVKKSFQRAASLLWEAATECHLATLWFKHHGMKKPTRHMDAIGEALEHGVKRIGKRMHRYGEKPSLDSVAIQGDWKKPADIYNTVNDRLTAVVDVFEKFYTQMLTEKDADSPHLTQRNHARMRV